MFSGTYEAAVIVGPEGGIIKDLELSTGARIKVETGKVKYKGTRIVALLIAQVKGGNHWSDGSGNFLENQVLERNNEWDQACHWKGSLPLPQRR